ncbi:MAG: NAD-binding protein [Planctomycetes bacterium]|nr:NAD-binding protein [Planctomycetota bacterium]
MKLRVRRWLHRPMVEFAIMALTLISVTLAVVEIDRELKDHVRLWVQWVGDGITLLFIVELALRGWSYHRFGKFMRKYWLDLLACLAIGPWPPAWGAVRILRLVRLVRIMRVGALVRRRYMQGAGGEFATIFALAVMVLVLAGSLLFVIEGDNGGGFKRLGDSLWWSVFSMVSGEPSGGIPQTTTGRGIALVLTLSGLCIFAVITGAAAALMTQRLKSLEVYAMDLDELEGHIIICGWDRRAPLVIEELQHSSDERDRPIVIVAELETLPELNWKIVDREKVYLVTGDCTSAENLEKAGIRRAAKAIIMSDKRASRTDQDRDARTILAALTIEKLNRNIYTCAELLNREHEAHLRMAGVEDVVCVSEYGATLISSMAIHSGISNIIGELLSVQYGNEFFKLDVPAGMEGKRFSDVVGEVTARHGAIPIAVERPAAGPRKREMTLNPEPGYSLQKGDRLIVISRTRPEIGS